MGTILDIIGSMIIRGAIVAVILALNINLHNALYQKTARASIKENIALAAQLMLSDIKLAGYGKTTLKTFPNAFAEDIKFYCDFGDDSTVETIRYYLGPADPITYQRILYRELDSAGVKSVLSIGQHIDSLKFIYFDGFGAQLPYQNNLGNVKSIVVKLSMQSPSIIAETINQEKSRYQRAFWERQIFPRNL